MRKYLVLGILSLVLVSCSKNQTIQIISNNQENKKQEISENINTMLSNSGETKSLTIGNSGNEIITSNLVNIELQNTKSGEFLNKKDLGNGFKVNQLEKENLSSIDKKTSNNENSELQSNNNEILKIECGKSLQSVYETKGFIGISRGMKDLIHDDALECFGEILLSNDCTEASIEVTHYFIRNRKREKENYQYTIFNNNGSCYIKSEYLDSNNRKIMACKKDISITSKKYKDFDISLDSIINTFTDDYLIDLHIHFQGVEYGFIEDKSCFILN